MRLEIILLGKDSDKVSIGQKIRFFINNETEMHEAIFYQTGHSINSNRTYKVYARVNEFCKNAIPCMQVNALIEAKGMQVAVIPSKAVVSFEDKDYIFVFDKNKE